MKYSPIVQFQRAAVPSAEVLDPALVERARHELAFTALRRRKLPTLRVADLDWLMLLELVVAHAEGRELATKDIGREAPLTTRLRYLDHLERERMIIRSVSEADARVTLVDLTAGGAAQIAEILADASIGGAFHPEPRAVMVSGR
jgi:hypothetical protein